MQTIDTKITASASATWARRRSGPPRTNGDEHGDHRRHRDDDTRSGARPRPAPERADHQARAGGPSRPPRRADGRHQRDEQHDARQVGDDRLVGLGGAARGRRTARSTSSRLRPSPITRNPNRIALGTLVSRATTATENVSIPKKMILVGSRVPWAMISPVSAARVQPSDHATCDTRLASMAASSASSRRSTTARIEVPRNVRWKSRYSSAGHHEHRGEQADLLGVERAATPTLNGRQPEQARHGLAGGALHARAPDHVDERRGAPR